MMIDTFLFFAIFGFGVFITVVVGGAFVLSYVDKLKSDYLTEFGRVQYLNSQISTAVNYLSRDNPVLAHVLFWLEHEHCTIDQLRSDIASGRCNSWESYLDMKQNYFDIKKKYSVNP